MSASASPRHGFVNALTVDIEDYFQVQALERVVTRESWDQREVRVERNTDEVLAIFAEGGRRATFFILGWVAKRHPALIKRIAAAGHEVASHGLDHVRVDRHTPDGFRNCIATTKRLLEDIAGVAVRGYRAPSFSIGRGQFWAYEILAEEGYAYSSSVYPVRHDNYGIPEAPRTPFRPANAPGLVELTLPTLSAGTRNLPAGGGGFFRLLPYAASRWSIARLNGVERRPCIFYFHPWEIDARQPRVAGLSAKSRFRHYLNLDRMAPRLRQLVRDFEWDRLDHVYGKVLADPKSVPIWAPAPAAERSAA
jgi:polysaccharide deacetylase family protein (PEP-CTERM system associated)